MAKCSSIFDRLLSVQSERNEEITRIFRDYRTEAERIGSRYSAKIAAEKSAELVVKSRAAIEAAHARAGERAQVAVRELKEELNKHVLAPLDPALLAQLRAVQDFNLTLSRAEIEGFASAAKGNLLALRCIAEIAAGSGYRMTFTNVDNLSQDLDAITRAFQPSCWCPESYAAEGLKVLPNVRFRGIDYGRPSSIQLATAFSSAKAARANLEEGRERWGRIGTQSPSSRLNASRASRMRPERVSGVGGVLILPLEENASRGVLTAEIERMYDIEM